MNSLCQRLGNYFRIHFQYLKTKGKGRKEILFRVPRFPNRRFNSAVANPVLPKGWRDNPRYFKQL